MTAHGYTHRNQTGTHPVAITGPKFTANRPMLERLLTAQKRTSRDYAVYVGF